MNRPSQSDVKTAVVTGGTRGIGAAVSLELAKSGYRVFALYGRNRAAAKMLETTAREQGLLIDCLRGDLTHSEKATAVIDSIRASTERVDAIVHCAASGVHRDALDLTAKHMQWTFEINLFAIHTILRELVPLMKEGGRIVGITSAGGTRVIPYYAAVGASKGALESLFRHYAHELAPRGIAVNCVCPGLVITDAIEAFPDKSERLDRVTSATPTGRLTTPEDVAKLVGFLCGPMAAQIVGQTIVIDGGKTLVS